MPSSSTRPHATQPPFLRRARLAALLCAPLALACLAGFLLTGSRVVLVHSGRWVVGAESGCLVVGQATALVTGYFSDLTQLDNRPGFVTHEGTYGSFAGAWRPFRAGGPKESRLLFPLWQPMLVTGLVAAYAFGSLAGARRARLGSCGICGYDLKGLPKGAACPECGKASTPDALKSTA